MSGSGRVVSAALVGGPMYDPLYESVAAFEAGSGYRVEVIARLPHPELNAFVKDAFERGTPHIDLLSTHTKYAPSQAEWLAPLDTVLADDDQKDLLDRPRELSRIGGRLLQCPRNLDVRLLHFRRDLFEDPREQGDVRRERGRPLTVPSTWAELAEVADLFTRPGLYGFLFPGRDSGLFGTFYEMLVARWSPVRRRASSGLRLQRGCLGRGHDRGSSSPEPGHAVTSVRLALRRDLRRVPRRRSGDGL